MQLLAAAPFSSVSLIDGLLPLSFKKTRLC